MIILETSTSTKVIIIWTNKNLLNVKLQLSVAQGKASDRFLFCIWLVQEWREFSGTILEWSKEKVVSGVVICEYTFDSFRHQRKNKQAKEKKEEKKILSCRSVSLYYVGCL